MKYFFSSLFFILGISHLMFSQNLNLDILVVAGGGGAGYVRGGGGGGGGYIYQTNVSFAPNSPKQITVGTGGAKGSAPTGATNGAAIHAASGTNSSFGSTYIAIGGGGGGSYEGPAQNGYAGGSGGGGANQANVAHIGYGGAGTSGQGNSGGNSRCGGGGEVCGGGGGGAGAIGTNGTSSGCNGVSSRPYTPGNGGNGIQNSITGTAVWYSGGGGGGGIGVSNNIQGTNGNGGGQASFGGGGQCKIASGLETEDGGPGVVIIRYAGSPVATGGTITQVGGFTIHKFTSNGTFSYTSNLPVELTSFQANCLVDKTIITWSTASEHNADYFDVEFSRNGTDWELVKNVKANGNSTEITNYSIEDKTHVSGLNYYRLKQFDLDGNFKIYNVISSDCGNDNQFEKLSVYPNPSFSDFTISFNNAINETKAKVKIYNLNGILEYENNYYLTTNQNNLFIKDINLSSGEYIVELISGDKIARFKQIIK